MITTENVRGKDLYTINTYDLQEQLNKEAVLTVIIPIRSSHNRDIGQRLGYCISDKNLDTDKVEFLVVDDGSHEQSQQEHLKICRELNIRYIYLHTNDQEISMSRARNIGAQYAISEYIMFMDVDLYPYNNFYNDILNEIQIQRLDQYANDFLMVGAIYLTKEHGVDLFFKTDEDLRKNMLIQKLLEDDRTYIEKFSTGTSVNVYNRYSYLSHGGYDEDFCNWGYEDIEFNMRMINSSSKFPVPQERLLDYKNFQTIDEYKGWKSVYRLFGDITFQKGIILFHVWHEVDENSKYQQGRSENLALLHKKHQAFLQNQTEPQPLASLNKGSTLLFSKTNPFIYNKKILPILGTIHYLDEKDLAPQTMLAYIQQNNIDRVLMFNPYGNKQRLALYQSLKQNKIPFIIAERGALRDSVFYDYNGFNAESKSYHAQNWDKELQADQIRLVQKYIESEKQSASSLEKQQNRVGVDKIRNELHIAQNKKILFVPLQRPSDSVIKYFCGTIKSYENFIKLVQETVDTLDQNWVVVVKKHPLEDQASQINNCIYSEHNIKDLLELCDAVLLINSGVGLLSMIWNKPVYYCGEVFYADERINKHTTHASELITSLQNNFQPDTNSVYKFLYFLIEEFYSFGTFTTKEIPWEDGGRMTITDAIDFYKIRNLEGVKLNYYHHKKARISRNSILFDRYKKPSYKPQKSQKIYTSYKKLNITHRLQPLKKVPLVGSSLLWVKHKILKWHT